MEFEEWCLLGCYAVWPHGVTTQKTPFFIVTAVKTSNLTSMEFVCWESSGMRFENIAAVKIPICGLGCYDGMQSNRWV
jgi:hypothetical protein